MTEQPDFSIRKFKRVRQHAWLAGVCGGLAYWLDMPTWLVRLGVFCLVVFAGIGIIPYFLLAIFAPSWGQDPLDYEQVCEN